MNQVKKYLSLDGDWEFAYQKEKPDLQQIHFPQQRQYDVKIPVPGYWDDYTDRLKYASFWSRDCRFNPDYKQITFPAGTGSPPDTSLPYLVGTGWYKKKFVAGKDWDKRSVTLHIGGVALEAWVWLNGQLVGYHVGHLTPFEINLAQALRPAEPNELIIAVANTRNDRTGCSIRGYKGKSGGITRSVYLEITGTSRIRDAYVRTNVERNQLIWEVEIEQKTADYPLFIDWQIIDPISGNSIANDTVMVEQPMTQWVTETFGLEQWSDLQPCLYHLNFVLRQRDCILDEHQQAFGLRYIEAKGSKVLLNGEPVFLRGLTDHAYFPETCKVPTKVSFYMDTIKTLKGLGFNWIRFHTWIPPVECMVAADQLGMMLQVETPNGFSESDWLDALITCRKHPSVIIYCCGNEVRLDEAMLDKVELVSEHIRHLVPDALFNPMEGLRGIEYDVDDSKPGPIDLTFNHGRFERLKNYSDVFAPHGMIFSYHSLKTDDSVMENRLSVYKKPCLMHEVGINDSYLNLDLEQRYVNTRIGTNLFSAARAYIKEMGLIENAPRYYQNSCRWMKQILKYSIENARRCKYVSGYDLLGAIDCHWHRTGYATGILNEFYELKAGFSVEEILRYNGRSVLLADVGTKRNLKAGDVLSVKMFASLYGSEAIEQGALFWQLVDEQQNVYARGQEQVEQLANGGVTSLGILEIEVPLLTMPKHMKLQAQLSGVAYELNNAWDYWVFPDVQTLAVPAQEAQVKIVQQLDTETIDYINNGGRVLLLGKGPFPSVKTTFQIMTAGRPQGLNATVIYDHAMMRQFPQDGYCDWQFYSMLEGGQTVVFNDLDIPFEPIVEMVSGYKIIRKQSSLFELKIGKGGLLVCTLNLQTPDAGANYLKQQLVRYITSDSFLPKVTVTPDKITKLFETSTQLYVDFSTDEGYDAGGHIQNKLS